MFPPDFVVKRDGKHFLYNFVGETERKTSLDMQVQF